MMIQSSGEMMQLIIGSGDVERMKQNLGVIMQQKVEILREELKIRAVTLDANSSWLERDTENLKYFLETRRHCLSFLFSVSFSETAPSGSKIKLKIHTVGRNLIIF